MAQEPMNGCIPCHFQWLLCEFGALRPLPKALIDYARSDTHYLLYVAEVLRGLLADQDLLTEVLERSQELCLRVRISFLP
ncbi:Protein RRP6-like 1 [Taenia solium]|eukprot:TsM_000358300 transcript=TsM_000358300 gene=TsM_000358300